jgi:hypothetical protein
MGKKEVMDKKKINDNNIKIMIQHFTNKYKLIFNSLQPDPRLFIGYNEPWKRLSPELLIKEGWGWVIEQEYDDISFVKPLPIQLNKELVPLKIRNKAFQKWNNIKNNMIILKKSNNLCDEDEDEDKSKYMNKKQSPKSEDRIFIDEDLQKIIEEEGW